MKNKRLTYFLLTVVIAVWGMIIYRVIAAATANDDQPPMFAAKPVNDTINDFRLKQDTTHLLLNYRDPFGMVIQKDTIDKQIRRFSMSALPIQKKPSINWNFIQYTGYMRNAGSKKTITLMTINGKNEIFTEGAMKDGVKLLKNLRDSVRISYGGKIKYISKKSSF